MGKTITRFEARFEARNEKNLQNQKFDSLIFDESQN